MNFWPSKYVFYMKNSGTKARPVEVGSRQVHGVDYMDTYFPVVNVITVRMPFAIFASMDLELDQMYLVIAVLYGILTRIYK